MTKVQSIVKKKIEEKILQHDVHPTLRNKPSCSTKLNIPVQQMNFLYVIQVIVHTQVFLGSYYEGFQAIVSLLFVNASFPDFY